ncbi:flagellar type III secretion system pore protein FliP [Pigmentibacter sp. JX0631]|uniref:flagellar type III secretion system pore protein FliP n=1 Tax=Pigmentibacter sp. JX0631 TaxID=2976982 RepID=UPI002468547E|nr:flagellar type III secretion system pore protein FliP [Pigmentibacter sp. JX0631]WGL58683.1 flagellar type III secretion system pore protein FliP [Pigmentibacter sp. JX0631]
MRIFLILYLILISILYSNVLMAQNAKNGSSQGNANPIEKNWQNENKNVQNKLDLNKNPMPVFSINIANGENQDDYVPALKVLAVLTLLTFGPAILLLMSAFTRILIVLSFLRQALGTPTMPPNQILIALSLFLTYFVMSPAISKIYDHAIVPYLQKDITTQQALEVGQKPLHEFMMAQVKTDDLKLFYQMSKMEKPVTKEDVPMRILVPSFVISELKTAFQIGFLVYLPFIVIDMIVSSVLMAMGMMMLPPTVVSLPLKLILFVVVDGWGLLAGSLIKSFN